MIWFILGALLIMALVGSLLYIFVSNLTQHAPSIPNQGKSVLLLSKPDVARIANVTLLTMVRTSDGKALWQYHLSGDLAGGLSGTADAQLRAGTAVYIVNGVVYFAEVLDASPDRPALTAFRLTALRADNGARVWQQQMQATTLEILGVSDGVLVAQATTGSNSTVDALTATGYRTDTGAVVWSRRLAEHIGYGGSPDQLFDDILYVRQAGTEQPWAFDALDARTGKLLWRSTRQDMAPGRAIASADGVVVMAGGGGVIGVREHDGALVWSHALSLQGGFPGALAVPSFRADASRLYFVTNVPSHDDLEINALRIADGALLWRQQVTSQQATTNQQSSGTSELVLANGTLYLMYWLSAPPAASPTAGGLVVQAARASDGMLGWSQIYRPGPHEAPSFTVVDGASASAVVAESTNSEHTPLIGLGAGDGNIVWQDQRIAYGELVANGKLLAFSVPSPPDPQFHQRLCALSPDSSAVLWQYNVDGLANWVIIGP
ncbi:MAG TPA: PQQ-binding-like beta-propeller repeat protein [Ktedonobacterales bacterium]